MKYKNCKHGKNCNNCCNCGGTDCYENSYEYYLRKKYKLSDDYKLLIKQGYISKDNSNSESHKVLTQAESDIDKSLEREIQATIEKIQNFIKDSISNIEVLEIQNSSYEMDEHLIHEEIESETESLFAKLSESMQEFTKKTYQKIYILSAQAIDEDMESTGGLSVMPNPEKELLNRVNSWMSNLKKQIFKNIDAIMDNLHIERKSYIQKGFFSDIFEGIINCFNSIGNKISRMVRNVVNWTKTVGKKWAMWIQGVEKYEIVFSGGDNACKTCREMAGKVFPRSELNISQTAPPFHPNCGCKIIPFVDKEGTSEVVEDKLPPVEDTKQYVSIEQLETIGFRNTSDKMVRELNKTLEKYGIITKDQISHFLAQCIIESWYGNGLTEISNWKNPSDRSKDREYFNEKYGDNRNLGNRGRNTDDGYRYRGAGYIHLTGRYNYQQFANAMNDQNIMQGANYVAENYAWEAAGWFWLSFKKINEKITPNTTVRQITRIVNGGYNDLDKREEAYVLAREALK